MYTQYNINNFNQFPYIPNPSLVLGVFLITFSITYLLLSPINLGKLSPKTRLSLIDLLHLKCKDIEFLKIILFASMVFYLIFIFFNFNIILLEDKILDLDGVKVKISNVESVVNTIGAGASFAAGIKAATSLLSKSNLPVGPKIMLTGAGGISSVLLFKVSNAVDTAKLERNKGLEIEVSANKLEVSPPSGIKIEGVAGRIFQDATESTKFKNDSIYPSPDTSERIIPNYMDNFTSYSPLERPELVTNNNLLESIRLWLEALDYIYLLIVVTFIIMLIVIFLVLVKTKLNTDMPGVKQIPLGNYLHPIIMKLISYWSTTNLIWIYFGLFFIFLNISCIIYFMGEILNNLHLLVGL